MACSSSHQDQESPEIWLMLLNPYPSVRNGQPHNKNQPNPITNLADERPEPDVNSSSVPLAVESMNMIEAGDHQGVENDEEHATPKVAEKLNLEKQGTELESYIVDKLSGLQPSFRTLFEPSVVSTSSTGSSSETKTRQEAGIGKSMWKKKIEDVVAKVSAKKQLQSPDVESILYETDVKGILKIRWEEERKKGPVKQRTRWPRLCICCHRKNSTGKKMKEWEFQLEEYSYTW